MSRDAQPPVCPPGGGTPRPYPRRVNTKGGTTRPRGRTKACSATAASGPPPPAAEVKGHRPRALEPLAPMSGPPAHGGPRGNFALTRPSAPPYPARALVLRCRAAAAFRRLRCLHGNLTSASECAACCPLWLAASLVGPRGGTNSRPQMLVPQHAPQDVSSQQATLSPARAAPTRESGGCPPPGFFSLYGGSYVPDP